MLSLNRPEKDLSIHGLVLQQYYRRSDAGVAKHLLVDLDAGDAAELSRLTRSFYVRSEEGFDHRLVERLGKELRSERELERHRTAGHANLALIRHVRDVIAKCVMAV